YRVVVDALSGEFDTVQIAMAAVKLYHQAAVGDAEREDGAAAEAAPVAPKERVRSPYEAGGGGEMAKIFVGAGRNAGVRPQDVDARFDAHARGRGAAFTRLNPPVRILARLSIATRSEALRVEYALKQLPRAEKLRLCANGLEALVATLSPPLLAHP